MVDIDSQLCNKSLTFPISNIMRVRFEDFIRITYHWGVQSDGLSGLKTWYAYLHLAVHKRRLRADCDVRGMIAGTFHVWYPGWNDLVTRIWSLQIQWYSNERWSEFCQGISKHYRDSAFQRTHMRFCTWDIMRIILYSDLPRRARPWAGTWHEENALATCFQTVKD